MARRPRRVVTCVIGLAVAAALPAPAGALASPGSGPVAAAATATATAAATRRKCRTGYSRVGGRCVKNCRKGYKRVKGRCTKVKAKPRLKVAGTYTGSSNAKLVINPDSTFRFTMDFGFTNCNNGTLPGPYSIPITGTVSPTVIGGNPAYALGGQVDTTLPIGVGNAPAPGHAELVSAQLIGTRALGTFDALFTKTVWLTCRATLGFDVRKVET